ncbi:MAG: STAS domain-containing protein [Candidatus Eremiobacteraeota bacterium]|nr:STAS domain-containing protein [Candidatus Eremiobacteraeota bacterium]
MQVDGMGDTSPPAQRLVLDGEYDLARKDEVAKLFDSLDGDGPVIIDLAKVTYMDSTVLHELAALRLKSDGRSITLVGVNPHLRRVLDVVNFDRIFDIEE